MRRCHLSVYSFFLAFLSVGMMVGCDDYDVFTSDRSYTLMPSEKEIRFDTLITTVPSSTKKLILFNRNEKGIRINQVRLRKGASSSFRINVDGWDMSRTEDNCVYDFEVHRRDSIIIRIEVTMKAFDVDTVRSDSDYLDFILESGLHQTIPLYVSGRDAYFLRGKVIDKDTTFKANRPVVIYDSLVVSEGKKLILPAGSTLMFHDKAGLKVFGTLEAQGTLEQPVTFRGDRTDHMFDYLPYDRLPGRWEGLTFKEKSLKNKLNFVDIHGSQYGIICDSSTVAERKLTIKNSKMSSIKGVGLHSISCVIEAGNCEFSNTLGNCVTLIGGVYAFVHCTFAQYYPPNLSTTRGCALYIANCIGDSIYPLYQGDFYNCLVSGYAEDELMGNMYVLKENEQAIPAEYHFYNCFLTTPDVEHGEDASIRAHYTNNCFENEEDSISHSKHFLKVDAYNYLYDFTPKILSKIRNVGLSEYAQEYPLDRLGRSRKLDEASDAGCYENVETK